MLCFTDLWVNCFNWLVYSEALHLWENVIILFAVQDFFVGASLAMLTMCASTEAAVRWTCGCVASVRRVGCSDVAMLAWERNVGFDQCYSTHCLYFATRSNIAPLICLQHMVLYKWCVVFWFIDQLLYQSRKSKMKLPGVTKCEQSWSALSAGFCGHC